MSLFQPANIADLPLKNRFVMAPMTRGRSPNGTPADPMAEYYAKRAAGGISLIISEGVLVDHPLANAYGNIPYLTEQTAHAWKKITDAVHAEGTKIFAQAWHCGPEASPGISAIDEQQEGKEPSKAATTQDKEVLLQAFSDSAKASISAGFDGIELHAAHGYLLDSFLRSGDIAFVVEVIKESLRQMAPEQRLCLRFSPWRVNNYDADYIQTPLGLERILAPLSEAGVDIFHASLRRHWISPFSPQDDLSLAGWTRKLTGKPTITVGNIGLVTREFEGSGPESYKELERRYQAGHFDLAAIGRPLITQPDWVHQVEARSYSQIIDFYPSSPKEVFP